MRKHKRVECDAVKWLNWLCDSLMSEGHKWTWRERRAYDRIRSYIEKGKADAEE